MSRSSSKTFKPAPAAAKRLPAWPLWLVLAGGASIKIAYWWMSRETPFYQPLLLDPAYYDQWAHKILKGDWAGPGVFYGLPLYPYFLALCYKLSNISVEAVKFIQIGLGVLTLFFIYKIGETLADRRVALTGAALAALYGPLFFHEGILIPEALGIPLYAAAFLAACKLNEVPSVRRGILFGVLAGLAMLTKAGIFIFVLVFCAVLFIRAKFLFS